MKTTKNSNLLAKERLALLKNLLLTTATVVTRPLITLAVAGGGRTANTRSLENYNKQQRRFALIICSSSC